MDETRARMVVCTGVVIHTSLEVGTPHCSHWRPGLERPHTGATVAGASLTAPLLQAQQSFQTQPLDFDAAGSV